MRTCLQIFWALLLTLLPANMLKAQVAVIDRIEIIPSIPAEIDNVKVICLATFSSGGCPMTSSSFIINDGLIKMSAYHSLGMLSVMCNSADTSEIGTLHAGAYVLIYNLIANSVTYDMDTIYFTVQQSVGIASDEGHDEVTEIYPNPATDKITISTNRILAGETRISIISIIGQQLMHARLQNQHTMEMNVSGLSKGIYILHISSENCSTFRKVVVD